MKKALWIALVTVSFLAFGTAESRAHCQIPCGIYDDAARFASIREHLTTIEKSMVQINQLSSDRENANLNQLVRWVENKDDHADQLTEIVTYYFMAQRVKPTNTDDKAAYAAYVEQVTALHQMVVFAMKCKQTADLSNVQALQVLLTKFEKLYNQ